MINYYSFIHIILIIINTNVFAILKYNYKNPYRRLHKN